MKQAEPSRKKQKKGVMDDLLIIDFGTEKTKNATMAEKPIEIATAMPKENCHTPRSVKSSKLQLEITTPANSVASNAHSTKGLPITEKERKKERQRLQILKWQAKRKSTVSSLQTNARKSMLR